jgi:pimeloyl-ACP methyl ester carboxylesterase
MRLSTVVALIASAALGAGCARGPGLLGETQFANLAPLIHAYHALPARARLVAVPACGAQPALNLAVTQIGAGDRHHLIVMVHGLMADQSTWRFVAGGLGADQQLLLLDLPGCGDSDKPDPAKLGDACYQPQALALAVMGALRQCLPDYPPDLRITLVGHSLGGAAALRMLCDPEVRAPFPDVAARLDRAVLLAPADVTPLSPDPMLSRIQTLTSFEVELADLLGVLNWRILDAVDARGPKPTTNREDVERLAQILLDPARLHAAQAMLRQSVPNAHGRADWPAIEAFTAAYAGNTVPCLILWGDRDARLPVAIGYKLLGQVPHCRLRVVRGAGHFLPGEQPDLVIALIRAFGRDADRPAPPVREIDPAQPRDAW